MKRRDTRTRRIQAPAAETGPPATPVPEEPEVYVPSKLPIELPKRYVFRGLLGKGGMGRVYDVEDRELGRRIALKALVKDGEDARRRFQIEAQVMAQLEHPHILPCYDFEADSQGRLYCTMRKVEGANLRIALDERPPEELLPLLAKAARGVAHAHRMGIVHRDVKPNNIMLGEHGEVWVVDWGLVGAQAPSESEESGRHVALGESVTGETQVGAVVGTLGYLAPEQLRKGAAEIGPPADVHGLGAILYRVLTGQRPYPGQTAQEIVANMEKGPPPWPGPPAPPALAAIAMKALAIDPAERYPTAAEFADDLEAYLARRPVSVYRAPLPVRAASWVRRHTIAVSVAFLLVLAGGGLAVVLGGRARLAADERAAREASEAAERSARLETAAAGLDGGLEEARRAHRARLARLESYGAPFHRVFGEPETQDDAKRHAEALRQLNLLVFQPSLDPEIARANDQWQSAAAVVRGHVESLHGARAEGDLLARAQEGHRSILAEELEWAIAVALATERATVESRWIGELRATAGGDPAEVPPFYLEAVRLTASMAVSDRLGPEHPVVVRAERVLAGRGRLVAGPLPAGTSATLIEYVTTTNPFERRVVVEDVPAGGASWDLPLGSYALEVRRGSEVFPMPALVERERETTLAIEIPDRAPAGMVWIPPGEFLAGGDAPVSWPRHRRRLDRGFFLSARELTVEEYRRYKPDDQEGREVAKGSIMSLVECEEYVAWLTLQSQDLEYFVPTESQWERAARGADGRTFVWGDAFLPDRAGIGLEMSQPVGSRPGDRSLFGVLDLTGNMQEWCHPRNENGDQGILRGGAYNTGERYAAIPSRNPEYGHVPDANRTFRVAARPK